MLEDGEAHVETDEVRQLERAHGVPVAELHRAIDVARRSDAGLEHADGLRSENDAETTRRKAGDVAHDDWRLAERRSELGGLLDDRG